MELINVKEIKKIKEARELINKLQLKLYNVEQVLDDLARAVEIAQVSNQYQLLDGFRLSAENILVDRLTLPPADDSKDMKITIVE